MSSSFVSTCKVARSLTDNNRNEMLFCTSGSVSYLDLTATEGVERLTVLFRTLSEAYGREGAAARDRAYKAFK